MGEYRYVHLGLFIFSVEGASNTNFLSCCLQYGIPPETIKDSMKLGLPVPQVYIVPVDRFCREMGPALGVNLAEFEFPGYFNFFICKKKCMLVVDSDDAEENIRRVFSETLLGPAQFRREENPMTYEEEDFAPDFPRDAVPNFRKELEYFRIMPGGHELVCETLLSFCHFETRSDGHVNLGVPPAGEGGEEPNEEAEEEDGDDEDAHAEEGDEVKELVPKDEAAMEKMEGTSKWSYSKARFMGKFSFVQEQLRCFLSLINIIAMQVTLRRFGLLPRRRKRSRTDQFRE